MATVGVRPGSDPVADDRVAQLDALYRLEYVGMVRLAYTLLANNAEAEEIVQDSLLEVYRRWHEIRKPGPYLRSVVVSRCRSALFQVLLDASSTGLDRDSKAQAERVRSVAVERIGARVGTLSGNLVTALDEALRLHLAL